VTVNCRSVFKKILSLVVIIALLSLRLSLLTEEVFVTPVEDAVFDIPFIAAEDGATEGKPPKVKPKRAFDLMLIPAVEPRAHGDTPLTVVRPALALLAPKDILSEIFIPPEASA
jgi:hypothetical protein